MMVWICRKCVKCKKVQSRKQLEGCLQKWRVIGENARSSYLFRNKQANLHEQKPTAVATLASEAMTTMAQDTADGAKTVPFASCERDWLSHSPSTSCKSERVPPFTPFSAHFPSNFAPTNRLSKKTHFIGWRSPPASFSSPPSSSRESTTCSDRSSEASTRQRVPRGNPSMRHHRWSASSPRFSTLCRPLS